MTEKDNEKLFEPIWQNVYDRLSKDIIEMNISTDQTISETRIASELGVSRSPVRTALEKLASEGLIEKKEDGTYKMVPLSAEECRALCTARCCIEGEAAALAAKRINAEQLERLKTLIIEMREMQKARDFSRFPPVDQEFHQIVMEASGNRFLQQMLEQLKQQIQRYRHFKYRLNPSDLSDLLDTQHIAIYQCLKNRMGEAAKAEMINDISSMNVFSGYIMKYY